MDENKNNKVINDFGKEWKHYNYSNFDQENLIESYNQYFDIFPWNLITKKSIGFDMGCGTGRWAQFIAPKVKKLNCIEPSEAIVVAKENLYKFDNIEFFNETTESCSIPENSQDFGYSLGVLHHIPDTEKAIKDCARLLKKNSPFLIYLYYNFDNKPAWFKNIWNISNIIRKIICKMPYSQKKIFSNIIAYLIYLPLSSFAHIVEKIGINVSNFPLSQYRSKSLYIIKNDALDRFGTSLEHRFSKNQIKEMLLKSGFSNIKFSNKSPFWCCIAIKK